MANLIQLEADISGTPHEIWINTDQIIGMIPDSAGTRIYLTGPVLPAFSEQTWVKVQQSPKQIRDKVVAERSTKVFHTGTI